MADKALFQFSIGVFGLAAKIINGIVRIKVNVRTDQDRQWAAAKLSPISGVQIVDCHGGAIQLGETQAEALTREIREETGGCEIRITGAFSKPLPFLNTDLSKPSDMAIWVPVVLIGEPKPSNRGTGSPMGFPR